MIKHVTPQVKFKSRPQRCPIKKAVIKNFVKFAAKHLPWSLKNDVGLLASSIIKKTLQRRRLPVELRTFLRTSILKNICKRLRFSFCIKIYRFVYEFDSAIIRGSPPLAFCEKGVLTSFTKSTRKNQRYSLVFNVVADLQSLTLSKRDSGTYAFL